MRTPLLSLIAVVALGAGCTTDSNDIQCFVWDQRPGLDGEAYCEDPDVKKKCEALPAAMIDGMESCAGDAGEEFDSKNADKLAGTAFPCENAYAMTATYDDCKKGLESPDCDGIEIKLPEACKEVLVPKL